MAQPLRVQVPERVLAIFLVRHCFCRASAVLYEGTVRFEIKPHLTKTNDHENDQVSPIIISINLFIFKNGAYLNGA